MKTQSIRYTVKNTDLLEVTSPEDGLSFAERTAPMQELFLRKCSRIVGSGVGVEKMQFNKRCELNSLMRDHRELAVRRLQRRGYVVIEFTYTK